MDIPIAISSLVSLFAMFRHHVMPIQLHHLVHMQPTYDRACGTNSNIKLFIVQLTCLHRCPSSVHRLSILDCSFFLYISADYHFMKCYECYGHGCTHGLDGGSITEGH